MKADIEKMKESLWNHQLDKLGCDEERVIALFHYYNYNGNQDMYDWCDWEDVDNMVGEDYLVLTDEEADDMVREYIEDSVWAFTPSFLSSYTGIDEEVFKVLQEKYEDANTAIRSMIHEFDDFVDDAVRTDGRGHFLSPYDGKEHEVTVYNTTYYIYRVN